MMNENHTDGINTVKIALLSLSPGQSDHFNRIIDRACNFHSVIFSKKTLKWDHVIELIILTSDARRWLSVCSKIKFIKIRHIKFF